MNRVDQFIEEVLSRVPHGPRREQIETDLRSHIAERVDAGIPIEDAIRHFGDPVELAESYLSSIPMESASFMSRVAARLVDFPATLAAACVLMYLGWQLFGTAGMSFFAGLRAPEKPPAFIAICVVTAIVVFPGYFIASEFMTDTTLGKHLLGLRVVRESGARIGLGQAFVRTIPLIGSFFLIDVLFALFTDKKQRAFELISKTRVVRVEPV